MALSRHVLRTGPVALMLLAAPLAAQSLGEGQQATPPEHIDILVPPAAGDVPLEDCSAEQQAASISGEIVVCRRKRDGSVGGFDKESAEDRYAAATMNKGNPQAPDMEHHYPGPVVARGCFLGPCPPPPAYYFDIKALPEPPPGSDADRIARGLAPRGDDAINSEAVAKELALPPAEPKPEPTVSPAGSASPVAEPTG